MCVSKFPFSYKDTPVIGLRPILIQYDLILTTFVKTLFPNKVTFIGIEGEGLALEHGFGGNKILFIIDSKQWREFLKLQE